MEHTINSDNIIQFNQLTTSLKSMESINSDERYFEGLLTVQMKDKQGEVTIVDELYKVLPIWMDRGAPISDTHSNRIIGKGINYSKTLVKNEHGEDLPAIKITGKIFKNYELDNVIWEKIKSKEYKGLSFGGATRANRTPMKMKDGSMAYALSNLEHYEVAVCKDPAVPMAIITDYNPIAKANFNSSMRGDDEMVIHCTKMGCFVDKSGYQTEAGNDQLGGQGKTEDKKDERKEEDEENNNDEVKRRDHSDSNGDITSTYNQNVGRHASSGRKIKADTTATQGGGGVRENSSGTYVQGSGDSNDINIVTKPERNEEKGAPNIKVVKSKLVDKRVLDNGKLRSDDDFANPDKSLLLPWKDEGKIKKLKGVKNSLEKHAQIQQLKKLNSSLGNSHGCQD